MPFAQVGARRPTAESRAHASRSDPGRVNYRSRRGDRRAIWGGACALPPTCARGDSGETAHGGHRLHASKSLTLVQLVILSRLVAARAGWRWDEEGDTFSSRGGQHVKTASGNSRSDLLAATVSRVSVDDEAARAGRHPAPPSSSPARDVVEATPMASCAAASDRPRCRWWLEGLQIPPREVSGPGMQLCEQIETVRLEA